MKATLYDGSRKVPVDTGHDTCLFAAARPSAQESGVQAWGKDLYMHAMPAKKVLYYFHVWSADDTGKEKIIPVSPAMADRFLRRRGLICNMFPENDPVSNLYAWGYGIAEEF